MHDAIPGVLPALVHQSARASALIVDESVTIEIAIAIDPVQSTVNVRQQLLHKLLIGGPVKGYAQQNEKKRSGVHRTVVGTEGHLPIPDHLSGAIFVKDLAGLLVVPVRDFGSLVAGEDAQSIGGQLRLKKQRLIGGNDGVASEESRKPWNAGGDHVLLPIGNQQGVEVAGRGGQ